MAITIPGGAYKTAAGAWVNARGEPIAAPKNLPERPEREEPEAPEGEITPGADLLGDDFGAEPEPITPKPSRSSSRKKS
jgi:hypothetical protein